MIYPYGVVMRGMGAAVGAVGGALVGSMVKISV